MGATLTGPLLPEDEVVGSVGLVEKQFWHFASESDPLILDNRMTLAQVDVAYETYGTLNANRDNTILILHGITGSSHAAGKYAPENRTLGYWDPLIGPGKVFDTNRFFVIAPNSLGGCRGSTGPSSPNPQTGKPYALSFPIITIRDMVRMQERFLREGLGITQLALVTGGSMGGMQALEWAVMYPERVKAVAPIATTARVSARAIAFNEVARRAICLDPNWNRGQYYETGNETPQDGLALARMISTITYLSDEVMREMFGRKPASEETALEHDLHARFDVERYLHDEGEKLVRRFDANSYLYLSKAMDLHDVSRGYPTLEEALQRITAKALFVAIRSDDLFPAHETAEMVRIMQGLGKHVEYFLMDSAYGHDAFLVHQTRMIPALRRFMASL
jgi:homoserine O-acetyltransferase